MSATKSLALSLISAILWTLIITGVTPIKIEGIDVILAFFAGIFVCWICLKD